MQLPTDKLAYSMAEWCEATGRSRSSTYLDLKEGRLRAKKCGKLTFILRDEGQRFLASLPDYNATAA